MKETFGAREALDRVPYTWDFGFLLCNSNVWKAASKAIEDPSEEKPERYDAFFVEDVWDRLCKLESGPAKGVARTSRAQTGRKKSPVSWYDFLKASKIVAEFQAYHSSRPATAFDLTMLTPESFSCLVLEMWASESLQSMKRHEKKNSLAADRRLRIIENTGQKKWETRSEAKSLLDALKDEQELTLEQILEERRTQKIVKGYSLELYKVWLLLLEVLNFSDLVDSSSHLNFEFKSRDVFFQAVSARHWYSTASKFVDSLTPEQLESSWLPVRLPGHFSVRADWFLAVAGGSRSSRLADHALDLLSSKRANITRLQEGIGLPTRTLSGHDSHLRTRLICALDQQKPLANVEYEALRRIGALDPQSTSMDKPEEFYWFWRSGIAAYNRHSRIWYKWLNRTLLWWNSWRQRYGSNWTRGFALYKLIDDIEFGREDPAVLRDKNLESWATFHELRNILIDELADVTISSV